MSFMLNSYSKSKTRVELMVASSVGIVVILDMIKSTETLVNVESQRVA
jgi:molybdenum cofactor biosynthesis enzyme